MTLQGTHAAAQAATATAPPQADLAAREDASPRRAGSGPAVLSGAKDRAAPGGPTSLDDIRDRMDRLTHGKHGEYPEASEFSILCSWHDGHEGMVPSLEFYESQPSANPPAPAGGDAEDAHEVAVVCAFGPLTCSYEGIVHGGIIAMAFDDAFGFAYYTLSERLGFGLGYTVTLDVKYRKPVPHAWRPHTPARDIGGSAPTPAAAAAPPAAPTAAAPGSSAHDVGKIVFRVRLDRVDRRKVYMKGVVTDHTGGVKYAEASALFYIAKKPKQPKQPSDKPHT